jgi:hypothetical protein
MKFIWNDKKKIYDIIFTPNTLFKGLDGDKPKFWVTRPWKREVVEVANHFKMRKALESLGIQGLDHVQIFAIFNRVFGKNNYCECMRNQARAIRRKHGYSINVTRDYFLFLMRDNDIEVINWDIDVEENKSRYSIEYNEFIYKNVRVH